MKNALDVVVDTLRRIENDLPEFSPGAFDAEVAGLDKIAAVLTVAHDIASLKPEQFSPQLHARLLAAMKAVEV